MFFYELLHMNAPELGDQQRHINQLCTDIGYRLKDLQGVMDDIKRYSRKSMHIARLDDDVDMRVKIT